MEGCRQSQIFVQCESEKSSGSPTVEPWCSGDAKLQIAHLAAATCQYYPDPKKVKHLSQLWRWNLDFTSAASPMSQPTVMRAAGIPITSRKSTIRTGRNDMWNPGFRRFHFVQVWDSVRFVVYTSHVIPWHTNHTDDLFESCQPKWAQVSIAESFPHFH